ncbi:YjiH family protein [Guptibacillus hwajinpoensis]|uniref:Nucleoside recognition membrane protein YjiH n=1 Tax=Guptibacillus hwajinpoensis TaxID=208199 RepID=A0ABU0K464_9BACL|nr:YjiH family protein [Alkalihalobacillus hemicentroti]MDQ0483281.1 nucleoside recognition membrane protein YjiH [Alkalihalobacillus hemicentroti]
MDSNLHTKLTSKGILKFAIPSLIGIFLFMIPIPNDEGVTIPIARLAGWLQGLFGSTIPVKLPVIMTIVISITAILTYIAVVIKPTWVTKRPFLVSLLQVSPIWLFARILGMIFAILTLFNIGPEWIWSDATGGLLLNDLIPILFSVFLFAGIFLPLLLNFGLLEFCGTLLTKIMRPIFTLPGRSSIDCLASWMGDGTIGVLLTSKQYEQGYYTKREAAVIGTTFSVVSITFSIVVLQQMKLEQYVIPYYLTIVLAGVVAAVIMPRIPPLSRKADTTFESAAEVPDNSIPKNMSRFRWGLVQATRTAEDNRTSKVIKGGIQNVLDMWMGVIPIVMAIGTVALIIAETTPIFSYLGAPFVPILNVMQVPEAAEAAQTMVIGFADMFLPAIIGADIESDLTRFVIASLSVSQLIYMSEVGGLLLGSKVPVRFIDLVIIFLERTIISLPIIVIMAHIIF